MTFNDILNYIFANFLNMHPLLAVLFLSLIISVVTTLIYKFATNQSLMKQLRDEMKELQKGAKELRDNPAKAMEVHKKAMEANMKYMSHSLKPTLITFIPIILFFSWMNANFAFQPIRPEQDFSISVIFEKNTAGNITIIPPKEIKVDGSKTKAITDNKVSWILNGKEGRRTIEFNYEDETFTDDILITKGKKYLPSVKKIDNSKMKQIIIEYKKLILIPLGFNNWFGWLGTYILSSLVFTSLLRKWLNIY